MPASADAIGDFAFGYCFNLSNLTIPDNIVFIGYDTFFDCVGLTSIGIPESVEEIKNFAFYGCYSLDDVYYSGDAAQWNAINFGYENDPLKSSNIIYNSFSPYEAVRLTAYRYLPFAYNIQPGIENAAYAVGADTRLPAGLELDAESGDLSGIPLELGSQRFTISASNGSETVLLPYTLSVTSNTSSDAISEEEDINEEGYDFVETVDEETGEVIDDGRVQDQHVRSKAQLKPQTMHSEGEFAYFRDLYIDGKKLIRGKQYTVEPGSTKITITSETFAEFGNGTHTIVAEFVVVDESTGEEESKYTVQNYTVTGLPSANNNPIVDTDYTDYSSGSGGSGGGGGGGSSPAPAANPAPAPAAEGSASRLAFDVSGNRAALQSPSGELLQRLRTERGVDAGADLRGLNPSVTALSIPAELLDAFAACLANGGTVTLSFDAATIHFDPASLAAILNAAGGAALEVSAEPAALESLNQAQREALAEHEIFGGLRISMGAGGRSIEDLNGGRITLDLPAEGIDGGRRDYSVFHAAEDGRLSRHATAYRDGNASFRVSHFSVFMAASDSPVAYGDVGAGAWYAGVVDYAARSGLMVGYGAENFAPGENLTRAMFAQILYNLESPSDAAAPAGFGDVAGDAWYAAAVDWASEAGVIRGVDENRFDPMAEITREQAAVMLYQYARLKSYAAGADGELARFSDAADVSTWAVAAMRWAVGNSIFSGTPDGTLLPGSTATRAECAKLLAYFCESFMI